MLTISVSVGEAIDKFSVLLVKKRMVQSEEKRQFILDEIEYLTKDLGKETLETFAVDIAELDAINTAIWIEEDKIRDFIDNDKFDQEFIECASAIPKLNDLRFVIKNRINIRNDSAIKEQKQHKSRI